MKIEDMTDAQLKAVNATNAFARIEDDRLLIDAGLFGEIPESDMPTFLSTVLRAVNKCQSEYFASK